jgi:hypothetical protein
MPNARAMMPDQISEVVGAAAEGEAEGGVVFQAGEAIEHFAGSTRGTFWARWRRSEFAAGI